MARRRFIHRAFALLVLCLSTMHVVYGQANLSYVADVPTARAFLADLIALYESRERGVIQIEQVSSTDAIRSVARGDVDLGGTARPARIEDSGERQAVVYPIVWDALAVIVNRENPVANISLTQLYDIYRGEITQWPQLGGADQQIQLFVQADSSNGIDYHLAELLLGDPNKQLAHVRAFATVPALERAVEDQPWAMAVTTYSSARRLSVKILSVQGYSPSIDTIASGQYLLFVPLYLAVREDNPKRRQVREFINFSASSVAQRVLRRNGVVPYRQGLALNSRQLERADMLDRLRGN